MGKRDGLLTVKFAYTHIEEGKEPYYTYEDDYTEEQVKEQFLKAQDYAFSIIGYHKKDPAV